MGLTRPALLLALLALLIAPAAAADMIYWEEPCDSLDEWNKQYGYTWTVSPEFSHGESSYGIGHARTYVRPDSYLYLEIPFPPAESGVQAEYLDFFVKLEKNAADTYSRGDILVNGIAVSDYNYNWDLQENPNRWIYVHYPVSGLSGTIRLEVDFVPDDGIYSNGASIMIDTIQLITTPVVPDFTATPTGGDPPLTVKFTDTTKWSDSIVARIWDFGDGAVSTERNPAHTYNYANNAYDVALTVTTKWGESQMTVKPAFITTGMVAEGNYTVDFTADVTSGESPLTVNFTATVSPADTNITTWKWIFGDAGTDPQAFGQTVSHTYNTYGTGAKYDVTLIGYASGTGRVNETTKAAYITVNGTSGGGGGTATLSTVKVRLIIMDYVGQRFENVTVTATPLESTGPWAWLEDLFGVPGQVDIQHEVLTGTTGTDGGIVFALVESVKYRIDISDPAQGISTSITLYPKEDEIPVYIWPATTPPLSEAVDYALAASPVDDEHTEIRLTYRDGLENTTSVTFYVKNESGVLVHSETETGGANVTLTYALTNEPGSTYLFGFEANHGTYGTITQDRFIRFAGDRPRVDFADWIPLWAYNWAAIAFIVCIAAIFGFQTLKFGVVIVPIFALIFTYMEWLDTPVLLTLCAMTLGILLYLRYSEGETGT